jgi:hypothetical protein
MHHREVGGGREDGERPTDSGGAAAGQANSAPLLALDLQQKLHADMKDSNGERHQLLRDFCPDRFGPQRFAFRAELEEEAARAARGGRHRQQALRTCGAGSRRRDREDDGAELNDCSAFLDPTAAVPGECRGAAGSFCREAMRVCFDYERVVKPCLHTAAGCSFELQFKTDVRGSNVALCRLISVFRNFQKN